MLYVIIKSMDFLQYFQNNEALRELIAGAGAFGPALFVLLQILQTVIAPIPANVTTAAGGVLFGPWGVLLTVIGSALGFVAVIWISRQFGRPLLEKIFKRSQVKKFDAMFQKKNAGLVMFIIFLLPCMPDDLVVYLAGLSPLPFKQLFWLALVGRLPVQALTNYFGMEIFNGDLKMLIVIAVLMTIFSVLLYVYREPILRELEDIEKHVEKFDRKVWQKLKRAGKKVGKWWNT